MQTRCDAGAEPDARGAPPLVHPLDRVHPAGMPEIYREVAPGAIVSHEDNVQRIGIPIDGAGKVTRLTRGEARISSPSKPLAVAVGRIIRLRFRSISSDPRFFMRATAPFLAMVALVLSGCGLFAPRELVGPVHEIMFVAQPDACGLAVLAGLQGQHFTALADRPLLGQLRVIWPGQEVMSGLVPDRLNAQVSDQGRIVWLSCG